MIEVLLAVVAFVLLAAQAATLGVLVWFQRNKPTDVASPTPEPLPTTNKLDDDATADTAASVQAAAAEHGVSQADVSAALDAADKQRGKQ